MRIEARMEIHDEDQIKIELVMPIIPNQPKIQCVKSSQTILITINAVFHSSENGKEWLRNITRMKEYDILWGGFYKEFLRSKQTIPKD